VPTDQQNRREPRLSAKSQQFSCGYGPRSIHLSRDRTALFVGCKDGSITKVVQPDDPEHCEAQPLCGATKGTKKGIKAQMVGARALCDLGNGWLAVGHDSGDLALLRWSDPGPQEKLRIDLKNDQECGAITHVCLWGPEQLLVSHRYRPAALYDVKSKTGDKAPELNFRCNLGKAVALGHVLKTGPDERILISKSGLLWRAKATSVERNALRRKGKDDLWGDYERPGFIFDATAIAQKSRDDIAEGAYLSTDGGVFLLRRQKGSFEIVPVNLQGFTGLCLAVTYIVREKKRFLWVSDLNGDVHLLWDDLRDIAEPSVWRRSGILQGDFPVMRALASLRTKGQVGSHSESTILLGQACRNDLIVLTWYSDQPSVEKRSQCLSRGDWLDLKKDHDKDYDREKVDEETPWCFEALIADYIEKTGAEEPEELTGFLRNPGIGLAQSALDTILSDVSVKRAGQAVTLWTHTLLGAVHRYSGNRKGQNYLGIIRWLRRLSLKYSQKPNSTYPSQSLKFLLNSLERNIQYARKWGVFGETYAERKSILSALVPLTNQQTPDRQFDRLVYESMLLQRRVDVEAVFPEKPNLGGKTPWDVKHLRVERGPKNCKEFIAASWIKGGVQVYTPSRDGKRGVAWEQSYPPPGKVKAVEESGSGYSRRILLGKLGEGSTTRLFLLEAPTRTGEKEGSSLRLHWIDEPDTASPAPLMVTGLLAESGRASRKRSPSQMASGSLEEQESVYSLLELDPSNPHSRLVLVGLQGIEGRPRIGLLRIALDGTLQPLHQKDNFQFPTPFPELRTVKRNPVFSLAAPEELEGSPETRASPYTVILGCGDGQIWKTQIQVDEDGFEINKDSAMLVGRLGTPVWALTYREAWPSGKERPSRVVAGGADGTLAAFQSFFDQQEGKTKYDTLWAMREEGPVARLHAFDSENPYDGKTSLILALMQSGTAVLISDEAAVEPLRKGKESEEHHRFRVPGQRLGRFSLRSTAFASALLTSEGGQAPHGQITRLVIATAAGTLRLTSLHYPKHTKQRHSKYDELWRDWLANLEDGPEDQRNVHGYLLRRPESVRVAAPELTSGLVRWILSPNLTQPPQPSWKAKYSNSPQEVMRSPVEQWVPRHLRPLVALDSIWSSGGNFSSLLKNALLAAREVKDKHLFKEILEVVLNRANHQLFNYATESEGAESLDWFRKLMEDLEEAMGAWLGSPDNLDIKMRITIAKNLLDGDTLWRITRARATERKKELSSAVTRRIEQIHRFFGHGDPLLSLETLRASNMALIRLCRRLGRPEGWKDMTDGELQLQWDSIKGFYEAVGDFAARAEHPKGSLGEVAAHEICRAYALGMLACPSALVPLALWMAEADVPEDLRYRVQDQFYILKDLLGMEMPVAPRKLFGVLFGKGNNLGGYVDRLLSRELDTPIQAEDLRRILGEDKAKEFDKIVKPSHLELADERLTREFGQENVEFIRKLKSSDLVETNKYLELTFGKENVRIIQNLKPFEDIVAWLHEMAEMLANDAGKVGGYLDKAKRLKKLSIAKKGLSHSGAFWQAALRDLLENRMKKFPDLAERAHVTSPGPEDEIRPSVVRPEVVLFSSSLEKWCGEQRQALRKKREDYEIFEPHSKIYEEALEAVERTANRFRQGAAVQKNMVLGVLGHGLLELLDEHLLELWEVAQALDPVRAWNEDNRGAMRMIDAESTAARFAYYMIRRGLSAETIPKNLRNLQELLCYNRKNEEEGGAGDKRGGAKRTLADLFGTMEKDHGWRITEKSRLTKGLDSREYHFLRLTLNELAQNDRLYGIQSEPGKKRPWRACPRVKPKSPPPRHSIDLSLLFYYNEEDDGRFNRIQSEVVKSSLQQVVDPYLDIDLPSHGTGLYLANLSAAAVGWKLEFGNTRRRGRLEFILRKDER